MAARRRAPEIAELPFASVELDKEAKTVFIRNLLVQEPEIYDFLSQAPTSDRTGLLVRALRVGAVALRDAVTAARVDFVQREFATLREAFAAKITDHFGPKGDVTRLIKETFGEDGELEAKLETFLSEDGEFSKVLDQFLGEKGTVAALLGEEGEFHERLDEYFGDKGVLRQHLDKTFDEKGGQLYDILSHKNEKGPLGAFMRELNRMFDADVEGSPLHQVRAEIKSQFAILYKDLGEALGKRTEKQKGSAKGGEYEDWVYDQIEELSAPFGDVPKDVGAKKGLTRKTGDTLVKLNPEDTHETDVRIVIEAKNQAVHLRGTNTIDQELDKALENRNAQFAIAVIHSDHAKDEFSPFRLRAPNKILCVADEKVGPLALSVAYRLARTLLLNRQASQETSLDHETIESAVGRITGELTKFSAVYTQITNVQGGMESIRTALKSIHDAIEGELEGLLSKSAAR